MRNSFICGQKPSIVAGRKIVYSTLIKKILMTKQLNNFLITFFVTLSTVFSQAVITLVVPPGARQLGMGEVGGGLLDKKFSYFYNPALPGISFNHTQRELTWNSFRQDLLPSLSISELYHKGKNTSVSFVEMDNIIDFIMIPSLYYHNWGYIGLNTNYISFGEIPYTPEYSEVDKSFSSNETVYILTLSPFGSNIFPKFSDDFVWNIGGNIKYIHSALAPEISSNGSESDGTANSFAFDLGIAAVYNFDLPYSKILFTSGFSFLNMGPKIWYVDSEQADPIPFTINFAYSIDLKIVKLDLFDEFKPYLFGLVFAMDLNDELVHYENGKATSFITAIKKEFEMSRSHFRSDIVWSRGIEYKLFSIISFRYGKLIDRSGERREEHRGWGVQLPYILNKFTGSIDFYEIEPGNSGLRGYQKGTSVQVGMKF